MHKFFSLIFVSLMWSPTFLFIKKGLLFFSPLTLTFLRLFVGLLSTLLLYLFFSPNTLKDLYEVLRKNTKTLLTSALLGNLIPFCLCATGEHFVSSSLAAIIEGLVPSLTLFFSLIIFKAPLSLKQLLSIILGGIGVLIIFLPTLTDNIQGNEWGILALTLMSSSFALGFLFAEKKIIALPLLAAVTLQLFLSCLCLLPFLLYFGLTPSLHPAVLYEKREAFLYIVPLGILGTGLGHLFFYFIIRREGASFGSMATYLCLGVAAILGYVFLEERLSSTSIFGTGIILISMIFASIGKKTNGYSQRK